jgi:hypothetical protein
MISYFEYFQFKKVSYYFLAIEKKTFYLTCSIKFTKSNFALTFHEKMDWYFCAFMKIIIDTISFHESKHTHILCGLKSAELLNSSWKVHNSSAAMLAQVLFQTNK